MNDRPSDQEHTVAHDRAVLNEAVEIIDRRWGDVSDGSFVSGSLYDLINNMWWEEGS